MALLQGTELYSTSITPNNPDIKFDAQVAGSLQAKYDAGYEKASVLYGSIMNPELSRQDTQKAKEEYLRMVDQDLKRVGKMDWSISQNVDSAENLFKGMWTNKLLLKDASWTKNYKEELSKAEGFKNCLDKEKCGGAYWDEGVKYMNYKREEFINADSDSALGFGNVSYVPYNSVMDDAIKQMKAADLSISYDRFENGYIITEKNGTQLRSPLTLLFNQTLGKDPKFMEMFKVKSFVDRKDWVSAKVQSGEYANESEANLNYLNTINNRNIDVLNKEAYNLNMDKGFLEQTVSRMELEYSQGEIAEGSDEHKEMLRLQSLKLNTENALAVVGKLQEVSRTKNKAALGVMVDSFDNENAYNYFNAEIQGAVDTLMFKGYEKKIAVDPYSMESFKFSNKKEEMKLQFGYNVAEENNRQKNRMELEQFKAEENPNDGLGSDDKKINALTEATNKVSEFRVNDNAKKLFEDNLSKAGNPSAVDFQTALSDPNHANHDTAKKAQYQARLNLRELKVKANTKSIDADGSLLYLDVIHPRQYKMLNDNNRLTALNSAATALNIDLNNFKHKLDDIKRAIEHPKNARTPLSEIVYNVIK